MEPKYYHQEVGANFRLDALQCAFLSVKLKHYAHYTSARQANAEHYSSRFSSISQNQVILPTAEAHNSHIWNQYTLRVLGGRRDELKRHLAGVGVGCEVYYPLTLDQQQCFAQLPEHARRACPVAHDLASQVLSIPIYPELTSVQRDEVASAVLAFFS
jgi:dTDP-4-amino-4,6-dideoxygalactose transaminase